MPVPWTCAELDLSQPEASENNWSAHLLMASVGLKIAILAQKKVTFGFK